MRFWFYYPSETCLFVLNNLTIHFSKSFFCINYGLLRKYFYFCRFRIVSLFTYCFAVPLHSRNSAILDFYWLCNSSCVVLNSASIIIIIKLWVSCHFREVIEDNDGDWSFEQFISVYPSWMYGYWPETKKQRMIIVSNMQHFHTASYFEYTPQYMYN